jgi:putative chitobiose transport system permease protein
MALPPSQHAGDLLEPAQAGRAAARRNPSARRQAVVGWLFVLPTVVIFGTFVLFPIFLSVPLAFFNISLQLEPTFVGLTHFRRLFSDANFWNAMRNTLLYLAVVPPLQLLSIVLAVLLNRKLPGVGMFRTMYYIPVVTSMVAVAITWRWLYQDRGLINGFLAALGVIHPLEPIGFLTDPRVALWSVMAVTLWKGLGYYMVIYLAGLQSVPKELGEAAQIDGAGPLQNLFLITIPLLRPYVLLCSLLSTIAALRVFDEVWVMTRGGPIDATMVANVYLYKTGFSDFQFGYAAAVGLALGVVVLTASIGVFLFNRKGGLTYY